MHAKAGNAQRLGQRKAWRAGGRCAVAEKGLRWGREVGEGVPSHFASFLFHLANFYFARRIDW